MKTTLKLLNTGNAFERAARMEKASIMFAMLPIGGATVEARKRTACMLRGFSQADRDMYAKNAGVASPSTRSWEMFATMVEGS